ncbi:hypothetical protein GCM10023201_33220 [Actinomycetospora corticicola]|uniref:Uncharacterized protein n=1 Tax=Actinomycetospora corticicola TaxID=663602 RepID=A0A7Y9J406_9PSEU|nr:hypothetical protein [Actinomycetospora corticicola]NYD34555.1 hypothetical protein [Actinomycetospora corticicola]
MNSALSAALKRLLTETKIVGISHSKLIKSVRDDLPDTVKVSPAEALDGPQLVVPLEALRGLAVASAATMQADLLQVQANWAVARYVGSFDHRDGRLVLSRPGELVAGNQRRVLSEELGIAFALEAAQTWMGHRGDPSSPVWIADVDQLSQGIVMWAEQGNSRPDYIVATRDLHSPGVLVALVESKGTRTPSYASKSLTNGCRQIAPAVELTDLPGLVVSTLVTGATITSRAAQVGADRPGLRPPDDELVLAVQAASFESLAEAAGNGPAADRWRRERSRPTDEMPTRMRVDRERTRDTLPDEGPVVGLAQRYGFPGGQLEVFLGVTSEIDSVLLQPANDLIATQQRTRSQRTGRRAPGTSVEAQGAAVGPDGSVAWVRTRS